MSLVAIIVQAQVCGHSEERDLSMSIAGLWVSQGRTYLCKKLDLAARVAVVRPADLKYYTKTRDFTDVHVLGLRAAYEHNVRRSCPGNSRLCRAGRAVAFMCSHTHIAPHV